MSIDFNTLDLEVMDISTNMSPDMYVNVNCITFSKKVLEELNYPAHVQFVCDPKNKVFGIRSCRQDSPRSEQFSKPKREQKATVSFGSRNVWEPVRKMMEDAWQTDRRYRVTGYLMDDRKTMIFVLPEGVAENFRRPKVDKSET